MESPPLLEILAHDPILAKTKLIAEAWDAGGLYQVGSFPSWGRWAEWNGKYRDDVRRFVKGDMGLTDTVIDRIQGSPSLYRNRNANVSINFITCHDGFTLNDLVSYNLKHNAENGENNNDGCNDNNSWNCGVEGDTKDINIIELRRRQMKNFAAVLLLSRGIPMLLAGDEFANSQNGNNNAYCQDNDIYWLNWDNLHVNIELFRFFKGMIAFRMAHPVIRNPKYYDFNNSTGYPEISWHQCKAWALDGESSPLTLAVMFAESKEKYHLKEDSFIYFAMNMHWEQHEYQLPMLPPEYSWNLVADTGIHDYSFLKEEKELENQHDTLLIGRSCKLLIGRRKTK